MHVFLRRGFILFYFIVFKFLRPLQDGAGSNQRAAANSSPVASGVGAYGLGAWAAPGTSGAEPGRNTQTSTRYSVGTLPILMLVNRANKSTSYKVGCMSTASNVCENEVGDSAHVQEGTWRADLCCPSTGYPSVLTGVYTVRPALRAYVALPHRLRLIGDLIGLRSMF